MKERIKALRKALGLTQSEFGSRIGVGSSTIATYETGREPLNPIIISICREFRVNEQWLRTGEGEMFCQNPGDPLSVLLQGGQINMEEYVLLSKLLALPAESRKGVIDFMLDVSETIKSLSDSSPPASTLGPFTDDELRASFEEQLALEKKPKDESEAS